MDVMPTHRTVSYYGLRALAILGVFLMIERIVSFTTSYDAFSRARALFTPDSQNLLGTNKDGGQQGAYKALVVASIQTEDTDWIEEYFPDWDINIYVSDDKTADLSVLKESGNEVAVYFTYIIQHYYSLPEYIVFMHARRYQWHNEDQLYDGVPQIKNLRLEHVKKVGYQSLRCTWEPGCDIGFRPHKPGEPSDEENLDFLEHLYSHIEFLFPGTQVPELLRAPCCGSFAVHRSRILAREPWEWERMRQLVWSNHDSRVWEYLWHMVMGQTAESCPYAPDCYCQVYGMCNLECPEKFTCHGTWKLPPWTIKVPVEAGWPNKTGIKGYPKGDWYMHWEPWASGGDPKTDPNGLLEKGEFRWDYEVEAPFATDGVRNWTLPAEEAGLPDHGRIQKGKVKRRDLKQAAAQPG